MDHTSLASHRGDYGYDAPYAVLGFTAAAALALVTAAVSANIHQPGATRSALVYFAVFAFNELPLYNAAWKVHRVGTGDWRHGVAR